jgi:hypothetical protein
MPDKAERTQHLCMPTLAKDNIETKENGLLWLEVSMTTVLSDLSQPSFQVINVHDRKEFHARV